MKHGTATAYCHHGCRCDDCSRAMREARQALKDRLFGQDPPAEAHGRVSTYRNYGCRCDLCVEVLRTTNHEKWLKRRGPVKGQGGRKAKPAWLRVVLHITRDDNGCWIWPTTMTDRKGYGQIIVQNRTLKAHRVSYEAFVAPIPDGLTIDHLCRVKSCVNPAHLEPVTNAENIRRYYRQRREEVRFCGKGHEFTPENTYESPSRGHRVCRQCAQANGRKRSNSQKAA